MMVLAKGMSGGNGGSGEGSSAGGGGLTRVTRGRAAAVFGRQRRARVGHVGSLLGSPGPDPTNSAISDLKRFCKLTQICNE
jgi:hypothetical protein